ncbi:MAG: thioredoxin [Clostridiaceae bacterium]|nr:thioredoxin [Clostridiaceae bacterium]
MSVFSVTRENFNKEVLNSREPVLLDFWAGWCMPCKMLSPLIDKVASENPSIKVGKVNVEEERELAEQFQIMGIPALILMKDGRQVSGSVGLQPKSRIEKMIKEYI